MKGLNDRQIQAVEAIGNTIVISGAGAGKTTVFVERLQKLLRANYPDKILALTFTQKAANEFNHRLNTREEMKYLGTFHAVFFKLLQSMTQFEQSKYSYLSSMQIYDEYRYNYYLEHNFHSELFDTKQFKVKIESPLKLSEFISKNIELALECENIEMFFEKLNVLLKEKLHYKSNINIIQAFFEQKRANGVLNFDDILIETYFFIKEDEFNRTTLQKKFNHILVDEFQDTNSIVLEILQMIQTNNLFMVGDPYQSIYSFQGANFKKTIELIEATPIIQLNTNYRSSKNIVNFSNAFIDTSLTEKLEDIQPVTATDEKPNSDIKVLENISDFTLPELIHKSNDELNDICILARNNYHIQEIKDILEKWQVPYQKRNYQELEYILYAMLLMIKNNYVADDIYFERFEIDEWRKIIDAAQAHSIVDTVAAITQIFHSNNITNYLINRGYEELEERLHIWQDKIYKIFSQENTELFLKNVQTRLNHWLQEQNYITQDGVQIMSIHKSKGLEFNTVILYNFEDGVFPRNLDDEEEKRLYYVAITRAKENLIITSKKEINTYTKNLLHKPYMQHQVVSNPNKQTLEFENSFYDDIDFTGSDRVAFIEIDEVTYTQKYQDSNAKALINNFIKETNKQLQTKKIKDINALSTDDIEFMLLLLEEFKTINEIYNIPLKVAINAIDTTRELFLNDERINYDYLNNTFTDAIHHLINYTNWADIDVESDDVLWMKRFKKIVVNAVSKKYTDITKEKSKKALEIRQAKIDKKLKNSHIYEYEEFVASMKNDYFIKSDKEKRYFTNTVLGMYDTLNEQPMVDLSDEKYQTLLRDTIIDFGYDQLNGYQYQQEMLMGNFINNRKKLLATKRWSKIKYIEHKNQDKRASFITFTLPSEWHRWKTKAKSLTEERKYGDKAILEDNPNFQMCGHNLEEHIINSAKKINEVWTYFYHILKTSISNYQKRYPEFTNADVAYFRQLEPHKNMTSHIHILIFVDDEIDYLVRDAYRKTIINFNLNPKFNDFQKILKVEDVKSIDFNKLLLEKLELIQEIRNLEDNFASELVIKKAQKRLTKIDKILFNKVASPASYIAKYTMKNAFADNDDDKDILFFNAWESMLGSEVKITGISNYEHTTQLHLDKMYKWYQENAPHVLSAMKRTNKPLYYWLEKEELNGNFRFEYERRVKEGFKNAEFLKDVNSLFLDTRNDNVTDDVVWEHAANEVLHDSKDYTHIRTDKKIIGFYVSKTLIDKHLDSRCVLRHNISKRRADYPHHSFLPTEDMIDTIYTQANANLEILDGKLYQKLYVEDMYIKGYISEDEIMSYVDFMIDEAYLQKIKNYPNYKDNVQKEMQLSFLEPLLVA
ncbi:ATP-dependent helicase [Sulfurimonas xiamenensis]|uniref:DNA 3'-5' helicase n=1 Tax=Sulfurimonas xiamenensis TaxID=2590021 RepID=A0AAJ4DM73_9BACT|nr:ATP-dependent helicase [Sulfurimonas xiamenensis]QFR42878.1 ATP-dependent helicase [Sulfurimonas xiamenensis]